MAATAVSGGLVQGFAGVAGAATLPTALTGSGSVATTTHGGGAPAERSVGFNVIDDSAETLDYTGVTGSLPAPDAAPLTVGESDNLELPNPWFSSKSGSVEYNVMGPDGTQIGTLEIDMYDNGNWDYVLNGMNNEPLGTMTLVAGENVGTNIYIEDTAGSPNSAQSLPADSAAEQSFIQATTDQGVGSTSFSTTSEFKAWSQPIMLVQGYNGQTAPSTVQTGASWDFSTTDTWGATVTAGAELGAFSAGVQASYQHSVTSGTTESTSYSASVQPGDTTYIWGQDWEYVDNGTMTVKIGNTTWTLPGMTVYNAVPGYAPTYSSTQATGNAPVAAGSPEPGTSEPTSGQPSPSPAQ